MNADKGRFLNLINDNIKKILKQDGKKNEELVREAVDNALTGEAVDYLNGKPVNNYLEMEDIQELIIRKTKNSTNRLYIEACVVKLVERHHEVLGFVADIVSSLEEKIPYNLCNIKESLEYLSHCIRKGNVSDLAHVSYMAKSYIEQGSDEIQEVYNRGFEDGYEDARKLNNTVDIDI